MPNDEPVVAGREITYSIGVTNNGPSVAQDVTLTDQVPPEVTASTPPGCTQSNRTISCFLDDIAVGQTVTVTITGTVDAGATGTLQNEACAHSASTPDPDGANNCDTDQAVVTTAADVAVEKTRSEEH